MSFGTWLREQLDKRRLDRRIQQHLDVCGCITFCPKCKQPHFDGAEWIGHSLYVYVCEACNHKAVFDYSYPVPVLVKKS